MGEQEKEIVQKPDEMNLLVAGYEFATIREAQEARKELRNIQALKEKKIKIGLISNCYSEEAVLIRESQLFPYFDETCLSYELGMKKPNPGIFLKCMEGLGVRAGECLYIGDGGSHELEAADIMGMTALQARWYIKEVPELDIRKEKFEQLETPMAVLEKI